MIQNYAALLAAAVLVAAVPAKSVPTTADLVEVADISGLSVAPDGHKIAFRIDKPSVATNRVTGTWFVVDLRELVTPPRAVAYGGELSTDAAGVAINEPALWSSDSRSIYFRKLESGEVSLFRASLITQEAERLDDGRADVERFYLSGDDTITYQIGADRSAIMAAETAEIEEGILIDSSVSPGEGLVRSGLINGRVATLRHTGWAGREGLLADSPKRWFQTNLSTLHVTPAIANEPPPIPATTSLADGKVEVAGYGEDAGMRDPTCQKLVYSDNERTVTAPWSPAECSHYRISSVTLIKPRNYVITTTNYQRGLAQSLWVWNVDTNQIDRLTQSNGLLSGSRRLSASVTSEPCVATVTQLICVSAGASEPPRLIAVDFKSGKHTVLLDPNRDLGAKVSQTRALNWKGTDGLEYSGQYYQAPFPKAPLFVTYYTCPGFVRGGMGDEWPLAVLATRGIAALCINRPFGYPLDPVRRYEAGRHALEGAVSYLASTGDIDAAKVGMGGLSLGSEIVMWVMMKSDILTAASVSSPSLTPLSYLLRRLQGDRFSSDLKAYWSLGAPDETPDQWQRLSPTYNVDRLQVPLLMQMPEQEYIQALDYYIPMKMAHFPVELYAFPQTPHQKYQPKQKLAVYNRNLDWFVFWLLGEVDPAPSKREQYARWEAMRDKHASRHRENQTSPPSTLPPSPDPLGAEIRDRGQPTD